MANATSGTINALVANGSFADVAGDNLDTGTAAVTLLYNVGGVASNVLFRVTNAAAHSATFQINAGQYPPAFTSMLGAFSDTVPAGTTKWFGPFASARFIQNNTTPGDAGDLSVTFTPSGGDTITGHITCFQVPKA